MEVLDARCTGAGRMHLDFLFSESVTLEEALKQVLDYIWDSYKDLGHETPDTLLAVANKPNPFATGFMPIYLNATPVGDGWKIGISYWC